jgi:putative hydrolase of the HAD superfamily
VIIFDLDDTLVEEAQTAHASFNEVARRLCMADQTGTAFRAAVRRVWHSGPHHDLCLELGIASWEGLWATFEGTDPVLDGVKAWVPTYRREAWRTALDSVSIDLDLAEFAPDVFVEAQPSGHPLLEGAGQTVNQLSDRFRPGLLTNGPSDIQRRKLEGTGLAPRFECLSISGETGVGKPAPAAFADVLTKLHIRPEDAVMVGDSWERDVMGAVSFGLSAVWIASGRPAPEQMERVAVIDSLEEPVSVVW